MTREPFQNAPYFDWSFDRWKLLTIVLLFLVLLLGTLFGADFNITNATPVGEDLSNVVWSDAALRQPSDLQQSTGGEQDSASATQFSGGEVEATTASGAEQLTMPPSPHGVANLPLTLSTFGTNAIVASNGITVLSGTGQAFSRIEVYNQPVMRADLSQAPVPTGDEAYLGVADVDTRGLWYIPLDEQLTPGQHIITLRELDGSGKLLDATPAIVVFVLGAGEQGPPSLATPYIRFPVPAAKLRSGPTVFHGNGIPGMQVRLRLNEEAVADAVVNSREEWRLEPDDNLVVGSYIAMVEALGADGTVIAQSPPVAFLVVPPVEAPTSP